MRRRTIKIDKLVLPINIATLVILILIICMWVNAGLNIVTPKEEVTFSKCVDGDTAYFVVDGIEESVRFLAIDTPETVKPNTPVQPYGKEASELTCLLLSNAESIHLEYEDENKKDKYNRRLAWVFADSRLIQEELLKYGYAEIKYVYGNYKYMNVLNKAQDVAIENHLGIWK